MDHQVSTFTTSDAVRLQYQHCQNHKHNHSAIIFVHGIGANKEQFTQQQSFADQYCVILPSLRGHGGSGVPDPLTPASISFERQAQDILELADHLGLEYFHFVGHSIGALIGFELMRQAPHRLLTISACGIAPRLKLSRPLLLFQLGLYRFLSAYHMEYQIALLTSKDSFAREIFSEMVKETHPAVMKHIIHNIRNADYMATIQENQTLPILLMRVEDDHVINRQLDPCLEELKGQRNLDIIRIHSTGHMINMETPDYFNQIIKSFLTKASFKDARLASEP